MIAQKSNFLNDVVDFLKSTVAIGAFVETYVQKNIQN
jgi:hypothetical protein